MVSRTASSYSGSKLGSVLSRSAIAAISQGGLGMLPIGSVEMLMTFRCQLIFPAPAGDGLVDEPTDGSATLSGLVLPGRSPCDAGVREFNRAPRPCYGRGRRLAKATRVHPVRTPAECRTRAPRPPGGRAD